MAGSPLSADEWQRRQGEIRAELIERMRQDAAALDQVTPGYQQPKVEHALRAERSEIEDFADRRCRLARGGGWFSYEMAVNTEEPVALVVTYWGGVWHERRFDLLVDDQPLTSQRLLTNRPGDFFNQVYDLPAKSTKGKARITVRFRSRPSDIADGVFGVKLMLASAPGQNVSTQRSFIRTTSNQTPRTIHHEPPAKWRPGESHGGDGSPLPTIVRGPSRPV